MDASYPIVPGVRFKDILNYPLYCVGDNGSVWSRQISHKRRTKGEWFQMTTSPSKHGLYPCVRLTVNGKGKTFNVHRLVMEAFVGPCPSGMEVCHDPDPSHENNSLTNLRYDTRKGNVADAIRAGRNSPPPRYKGKKAG